MRECERKSPWRRVLSLLLCLVVVCSLSLSVLQPAEAKDNRMTIYSLSFGRQAKGDCYTWNMDTGVWRYKLYKITVPNDGTITVTNNIAGKVEYNYFYLYRNAQDFLTDKKDYGNRTVLKCRDVKKSLVIPVKKGTYYIHSEGWGSGTDYKKVFDFSVKFTAKAADKNTTKAKAAALKSGAKATANSTGKSVRWYKISVPKAKAVTVAVSNASEKEKTGSVALYNAKGKAVTVKGTKTAGVFKSVKLSKGTYYLKVTLSGAGVYRVSWK